MTRSDIHRRNEALTGIAVAFVLAGAPALGQRGVGMARQSTAEGSQFIGVERSPQRADHSPHVTDRSL